MASFHVLEVNAKQDQARIAFHIDVPDELNAVNVNLRDALVEWKGQTTQVPNLDAHNNDAGAESTAISNGAVYEHIESVQYDATLPNPDKLALIETRYNDLTTIVVNRLRNQLKFWGYDKEVI